MDLDLIALLRGMEKIKGEKGRAKGIAMIIIAKGELTYLEILSDLTNASNRPHGVGVGKPNAIHIAPNDEWGGGRSSGNDPHRFPEDTQNARKKGNPQSQTRVIVSQ